jgi:hypothetical protein
MAVDTQPTRAVAEALARSPRLAEQHAHEAVEAHPARQRAARVGRFLLHVLEMEIAMQPGMALFGLLARQLQASPRYGAAFAPEADLWILGHGLFMTAPMVAWMVFRGHGWKHSLAMGASMVVPAVAVIVLCWFGAGAYMPWLRQTAGGLMTLGMLIYMLARYDHFSGHAGHPARAALAGGHASHGS